MELRTPMESEWLRRGVREPDGALRSVWDIRMAILIIIRGGDRGVITGHAAGALHGDMATGALRVRMFTAAGAIRLISTRKPPGRILIRETMERQTVQLFRIHSAVPSELRAVELTRISTQAIHTLGEGLLRTIRRRGSWPELGLDMQGTSTAVKERPAVVDLLTTQIPARVWQQAATMSMRARTATFTATTGNRGIGRKIAGVDGNQSTNHSPISSGSSRRGRSVSSEHKTLVER
jgi:hypothetical protein